MTPEETEAEALGAGLVLCGKADAVVSEDTDVVVFEAELVRRLNEVSVDQSAGTEQGGPIVMRGAQARRELEFARVREKAVRTGEME